MRRAIAWPMRPRPMKATFTTNLRSSISSDRRVTVITYNRAANGTKNRTFAPPDVPQPRPGNLEIRNCGDHQVETCQIGCGFGQIGRASCRERVWQYV